MMISYAIILTAAIVICDGSKKPSGEIQNQRLDMSGKWEGTFQYMGSIFGQKGIRELEWKVVMEDGKERCYDKGKIVAVGSWKIVDEGSGKFRMNGNKDCWGIYKVEGDRITLCISDLPNPRPKEFRVTNRQALFILHRVK